MDLLQMANGNIAGVLHSAVPTNGTSAVAGTRDDALRQAVP